MVKITESGGEMVTSNVRTNSFGSFKWKARDSLAVNSRRVSGEENTGDQSHRVTQNPGSILLNAIGCLMNGRPFHREVRQWFMHDFLKG